MRRLPALLVMVLFLFPALAFAQQAAPKKEGAQRSSQQTVADRKRSQDRPATAPAQQAAAPVDPDAVPPLDVSRMMFDGESIRQVVRHHMPEVQACYEKVLANSGQRIEGRVMVGFTIDTKGNVIDLKALPKKSTVKDDRVVDCVLLKVRRLVFPKPADNRVYPIEYPFDLSVRTD